MTDKELKKLGRKDLLELLLDQRKENERLRKRVQELEEQIEKREITVKEAGTIAEAALKLNGVLEVVETSVEQYLESVKELNTRQEETL